MLYRQRFVKICVRYRYRNRINMRYRYRTIEFHAVPVRESKEFAVPVQICDIMHDTGTGMQRITVPVRICGEVVVPVQVCKELAVPVRICEEIAVPVRGIVARS